METERKTSTFFIFTFDNQKGIYHAETTHSAKDLLNSRSLCLSHNRILIGKSEVLNISGE